MFRVRLATAASVVTLFGALGSAQGASVGLPACPGLSSSSEPQTSVVFSDTQPVAGGNFSYNFKICNTSNGGERETTFLLRDWELPYDPAGGITDFVTPAGWGWAIETIGAPNASTGWDGATPTWFDPTDPFFDARYLGLSQVIHFYTCGNINERPNTCYGSDDDVFGEPLRPGEGLEGFGFTSPFGATNAPYQASWVEEPPRSGDPDFPQQRNLLVGPNTPALQVPEPGAMELFALSLGALMAARARRRSLRGD